MAFILYVLGKYARERNDPARCGGTTLPDAVSAATECSVVHGHSALPAVL